MKKNRAIIFLSIFLLCGSYVSGSAHASRNSYFVMSETRSENLRPFPKWSGMRARFGKQEKVPDDECDKAEFHPCVIKEWRTLISDLQERSFSKQLREVNDWGNKHPYIVDQLNWGLEDYWETPYEFMTVNGDCEDYAIAKYYSLRAMGIPTERLRIIILQDLNLGGIIHAILGVYSESGELFILDNQAEQVIPALKIYHYRPIYGLNEEAWWAYNPQK